MKNLLFGFVLVFSFTNAQAQEEDAPPAMDAPVEKIVVTGSYIKRIDEEGPAAVQTLGKEELQKSGQNSVADVLRNTAVTGGVTRENGNSSQPGVATASLRGFGSGDILVLLNGQRVPKSDGGNSVDLNLIPVSAIERVEILKDGASALYGSDALGGVMNFITKKNLNGGSTSIRYSQPKETGGSRLDVSGTFGQSNDKAGWLGVVQYRDNTALYHRDREMFRITDVAAQGSPTGSPGSWIQTPGGTMQSGSPSDPCPAGQTNSQGRCAFDFSKYSQDLPELRQLGVTLSGRYKISENLKASVNIVGTRREVETESAPGPDNLLLTQAQANAVGIPSAGNTLMFYRTVEELGPRTSENFTNAVFVQPSLEGKLGGTWDWELSGTYGISKSENKNPTGYANKAQLLALIDAGTWKPFTAGNKGSVASASYQPFQNVDTGQGTVRLLTTGQLGEVPLLGQMGMAAGVSADWQDYKQTTDSLTATIDPFNADPNLRLPVWGGGTGTNGEGRRNAQAAFTEFNAFPIETVEIGLAARYDHFSDFGNTINPKLSLSWSASPTFMLRTSVGTGFRAPNLDSLYSGPSTGAPLFVDTKGCDTNVPGTCQPRQYRVTSSGNKNLREETSIFYNVGFVAQPKKNWNITSDLWYAEVKDRVGYTYNDMIRAEQVLGPAAMQSQFGIIIRRNPDGSIEEVFAPQANTATEKMGGIDFSINHVGKANLFNIPLNLVTSFEQQHVLKQQEQPFPGVPTRRQRDINWRNVTTFGVNHSHHTVTLIARTFAADDKDQNESETNVVGYGTTVMYTEYDLQYTHSNILKGSITAGVRNLFNSDRPLDDTAGSPSDYLNRSLFDPVGQSYYLGYTYNF